MRTYRCQLRLLTCSMVCLTAVICAQDYAIQPTPPDFTQDRNTTFLINLTTVTTQANFALGSTLLTLNQAHFQAGAGYTGPITIRTQGNWPTNAWTLELLLRVPYQSGLLAGTNPIGFLNWQSPMQACSFDTWLDAFGVHAKLYSWNPGSGYFLSQPCAGGDNHTIQKDAPDKWFYLGVGCDFSNQAFMTAAREVNGAILNSNLSFRPVAGVSNAAAAWVAMQRQFAAGLPDGIRLGSDLIQIRAIKISNIFRTNLFALMPLLPKASATLWTPLTIDASRATNRTVPRQIGYGPYNNVTVPMTESYLELTNGSAPITLQLTNLAIGLYTLYIYGTVDPRGRSYLPVVWQPCPISFRVHDGSGNRLASGKMLFKQSFKPRLAQGFSFHLDTPNPNVTVIFALDTNAMESAQVLWIRLYNQMAASPMVAVKTAQTLGHGPTNQYASLPAGWQTNDDALWNALPPLNVPIESGAAAAWMTPPTNVDVWITKSLGTLPLYQQPAQTFSALDFLDMNTGCVVPQSQILNFVPLPGKIYNDAGLGTYFSSNQYFWLHSAVYDTTRAQLLGARYILYFASIVNSQGSYYGLQNAQQYFDTGSPSQGHDGALALVRLAYDWPALEMNLQQLRCTTTSSDPDFGEDFSSSTGVRLGKLFYAGWSGRDTAWLFTAYDQLFPYINENQLFASEVHRYVPWVKTPQDVIKLLDNYLVFPSVRDVARGLIDPSAGISSCAAQLLGPSVYSESLFDLTHQFALLYPTSGGTYQEMYGTALSRSGTKYIGSFMCYGVASAEATIQQASVIKWAKTNAISVPMDLSDVTKYPKVRGAGNYLVDMWVAGGFPFMIGDASGGTHSSLFVGQANAATVLGAAALALEQAFNLEGDPRIAWLLTNKCGNSNAVVAAAAAGQTDPIMHASHHLIPDWGAVLEMDPAEPKAVQKTAATIRLGIGLGHVHSDYLDLNLFGMGLPLAVNLACRDEGTDWSLPSSAWSLVSNHALSHSTLDAKSGAQNGEPWLEAFAPPLVRARYADGYGGQLCRQVFLMKIGNTNVYYIFDLQWLAGGTYHTWAFHGCESTSLLLNISMSDASANQWLGDDLPGTRFSGAGSNYLQGIWTMTRNSNSFRYAANGGGTVQTVACEQTVLGTNYNATLAPVNVRATLLGRSRDVVLQGNPYSPAHHYCFPFLWCQTSNEVISAYPAVYDWYRGSPLVSNIVLVATNPVQVRVLAASQTDTYQCTSNYFLVVSRGANGIHYVKLNGSIVVNVPDLKLIPGTNYAATITAINYQDRTLTASASLPPNPLVTIGNSGRQISLQLHGSGTSFSFEDDLLTAEGQITRLHVTSTNTIAIALDQSLLFDNEGNRHSTSMVLTTEDGRWHFRDNAVIASPPGVPLTTDVFTDANGDGLVDARIYEIGEGDTVSLPADVTIQESIHGWSIMTNVPLSGSVDGVAFNLPASSGWQQVRSALTPPENLRLLR